MDKFQHSNGFPQINFDSFRAKNPYKSSNIFHPTFPHFKDYFQLGSTSYYILTKEYGDNNPQNERYLESQEQYLEVSVDGDRQQVHPDDIGFYIECEKKSYGFFEGLSHNEILGYKTRFDFRVGRNGCFKRFLQQRAVWESSEGIVKSFLVVMTDISHLKREQSCHYSILALAEEENHAMNSEAYTKSHESIPFSRREREVFHYLVKHMDSKEIASKLFISAETVRSHRKRILRKVGCENTLCLIMKSFENGWI